MIHTPKNSKFLFDFHGVVVTEPFNSIYDIRKLFRWDIIPVFNSLLPYFIIDLVLLLLYHHGSINGKEFKRLCIMYEQTVLLSCILDIANSFVVYNKTVDILNDLKDKGYEIDMLSNIDKVFMHDLETNVKYKHIQESVLSLFTNKKVSKGYKSTLKPDVRFFIEYNDLYNKDNKYIFFVDDNKQNVDSANLITTFHAILFEDALQVRKYLTEIFILDLQ